MWAEWIISLFFLIFCCWMSLETERQHCRAQFENLSQPSVNKPRSRPLRVRPRKSLQIRKPDTKSCNTEGKQEVDEENWIGPRPDKCGSGIMARKKKKKNEYRLFWISVRLLPTACFKRFVCFFKLWMHLQLLIAFMHGQSCFFIPASASCKPCS